MSGDKSPRFSPIQQRIKTSTLLPGFHKYPNFYTCYLLRSYHNGGAVRTKYHRPWEMELICFGFPSKPVVLQSRHLQIKRPVNSGLIHVSQIKPVEKINSQPEIEKIAIFPKSLGNQLEVKLKILRKMMSIKPWSCYPLKIIFFEESAYQLWLKQANEKPKRSTSRTAESGECEAESYSIDVSFRPEGVDGKSNKPLNVNNDEAILEDYKKIEEIRNRCNNCKSLECYLCGSGIVLKDFLTYVCCLLPTCFITLHLFCLSKYYLEQDSSHSFNADKEGISYKCQQIVPDSGSCPACYTKACWCELIHNCYRRMAANLQDKMSNSSKSEDEHTKDTVMDKEKEDTLDERMSHTSSAENEQVKASCAQKIDDVSLCQSESVSNNILSSLAPLAKPKFLATRKKIQKNKNYASGQKTCQSNSIERSREKNSPQHLRSKPSYKKVDPDEDEGEDKIVQMMDELEFDE
ncbi:hypothetical protein PPACK8108_LOCUS17094 [Phakopsora pachyrhizi]|uniref:Structure-specific endonuclease subunit SLX1 C-terminal domain-containing protein n=1 Tax=Phakopsora pachyrhizi TaxID=170000 RepID=A0AAV0BBF2_PHAPC|nr:hypothetical protein PPACK8108_LOCUS17094 [Phakopsora pachyrhizi]